MRLIKFGEYVPPAPTSYDLEVSDIDGPETGRGETGVMDRERVRAGVYKINVEFQNITSLEVLRIKESVAPEKITVEFFDGNTVSAQMYVGNRKVTLKSIDDESNCFWDVSFSLTEY